MVLRSARLCSGPGESQVHIPDPGAAPRGGGLAGPWGPGSRVSLGGHGLAAQRAPTPARTSAPARTPALPPQSRSAACAAYRWLSIPICILGFHGTFSVVLFTSVFSGGADGPLFRRPIKWTKDLPSPFYGFFSTCPSCCVVLGFYVPSQHPFNSAFYFRVFLSSIFSSPFSST